MPNTALSSTTQQFLEIHDIINNFVILKDGSTAIIITVDALNFGLLAEEEQDGIIYSYARLLNSLNYPIQILIRSQTKDITRYLQLLTDQMEKSGDRERHDQISRYRDFVGQLIQERNVLDKKFYVIVPASALEMGLLPPQTVVPGVKQVDISTVDRSVILEKARNILEPKRDHLIAQFGRIGLFARQLKTQDMIQLFYVAYNPEASEGQHLTDSRNYTTPAVKATMIEESGPTMTQVPIATYSPATLQQTQPTLTTVAPEPATLTQESTPAPQFIPQSTAATQMVTPPPFIPIQQVPTPTPVETQPLMQSDNNQQETQTLIPPMPSSPIPSANPQDVINGTLQQIGVAEVPTPPPSTNNSTATVMPQLPEL